MSLINIINELVVKNVQASIKFYQENLKFEIEMTDGEPIVWAQLKKDESIIMIEDYNTVKEEIIIYPNKVNSSNLIKFEYDNIEEVKNLYDNLKQNKIEFFMEYTETDYGKIEFGVFDPDKNMILISALI